MIGMILPYSAKRTLAHRRFSSKLLGKEKRENPTQPARQRACVHSVPSVPSVLCFVCVLCVLLEGLGCRRVVSSWDVSVAWSVARAGASRDRIKNRLCDVAFGPETFD